VSCTRTHPSQLDEARRLGVRYVSDVIPSFGGLDSVCNSGVSLMVGFAIWF